MVQTFRSVSADKANSRKWKGFNRVLLADIVIVAVAMGMGADTELIGDFLIATGLLYGAFAGANAFTHGHGGENG